MPLDERDYMARDRPEPTRTYGCNVPFGVFFLLFLILFSLSETAAGIYVGMGLGVVFVALVLVWALSRFIRRA